MNIPTTTTAWRCPSPSRYAPPSARDGADLTISSTVPVGAGLSSSHSLECAVALALCGLAGVAPDRTELALVVQRAENDYVGAPTGLLDQMAVLHSVAGHLSFFDARAGSVRHVPVDLAAAGVEFLVVDTNAPHRLVDGAYADRRRSCEAAAARLGVPSLREVTDPDAALSELTDDPVLLRRARYILGENVRVLEVVRLVESARVVDVGPVLTASHAGAGTTSRTPSRRSTSPSRPRSPQGRWAPG